MVHNSWLPSGVELIISLSLVGTDIIVNWNNVLRSRSLRRFRAHKSEFHTFCCISTSPHMFYSEMSADVGTSLCHWRTHSYLSSIVFWGYSYIAFISWDYCRYRSHVLSSSYKRGCARELWSGVCVDHWSMLLMSLTPALHYFV